MVIPSKPSNETSSIIESTRLIDGYDTIFNYVLIQYMR